MTVLDHEESTKNGQQEEGNEGIWWPHKGGVQVKYTVKGKWTACIQRYPAPSTHSHFCTHWITPTYTHRWCCRSWSKGWDSATDYFGASFEPSTFGSVDNRKILFELSWPLNQRNNSPNERHLAWDPTLHLLPHRRSTHHDITLEQERRLDCHTQAPAASALEVTAERSQQLWTVTT